MMGERDETITINDDRITKLRFVSEAIQFMKHAYDGAIIL